MDQALAVFRNNIDRANDLASLYDWLGHTVPLLAQYDDLLRSQIVNVVSAFDKLMHDFIRIGMVEIFEMRRPPTNKYLNEVVAIQHLPGLVGGPACPPSAYFDAIVREKLSKFSFQQPTKIVDGLSYIWMENHKWQMIARNVGMAEDKMTRRQQLIVTRRNAIVHEADLDPITNEKQTITRAEATDISNFLLNLGTQIYNLVTLR